MIERIATTDTPTDYDLVRDAHVHVENACILASEAAREFDVIVDAIEDAHTLLHDLMERIESRTP